VAKRLDGSDKIWHGCRPRPRRHIVRLGPSPSTKTGDSSPPLFGSCIVAKRLDGSRWHLIRRYTSALATLCQMGTQPPSPKGASPLAIFGPCLLWLNGWMDQAATWYGGRPRRRLHCVWHIVFDGVPAPPPRKGHRSLPVFLAHDYCGQTVARLSYC